MLDELNEEASKEELAFDMFFSEFVEYKTAREILKFLFSLPVGTWFNTFIFVEKFKQLKIIYKNNPILSELNISICWLSEPNHKNKQYKIILFMDEKMNYYRLAYYNSDSLT